MSSLDAEVQDTDVLQAAGSPAPTERDRRRVARRTVAKYRESLRIPSSIERRREHFAYAR